jgi:dephospho-CoA kinase
VLRTQQPVAVGVHPEVVEGKILFVEQPLFRILRQVIFEQAAEGVVLQKVQHPVVRRKLR